VIAVDTNLLVYAHRSDSPWNEAAYACIRDLASSGRPWAIAWPCVHEFFAIVTHPRIYGPPSTEAQAIAQIEAWLACRNLALLAESDAYWPNLKPLLEAGAVVGPRVHDARIAAICRLHGVRELWTADRDFRRFPGVPTRNPLVA